ncbi:nucleotidyltransferase [Micromonospora deserti]|uniref:Nucleotidyltransferase n=2 Tax=Micromonospora deserti TaxID=2070366 RepID=A0A2W2D2Y2_9ACTN|nr:nucleotidyltransferase [Micromonospora deserti]
MHLLLSGIVGSVAYGLSGPGSDIDRIGVFAAPTAAFHGLHPPRESVVTTNPDTTRHEAAKYLRLALGGNPTATELMWLPDDCYETRTEFGERLIGIRSALLSAPRVRDAYLGYAGQQFRKLESRGNGTFSADTRRRTAKHARHLARLVHQGRLLYATGVLEIRLAHPEWFRAFGERVAGGELDEARTLLAEAEQDFDRTRSPLPDRPDEATAERWLLDVRAAHLPPALSRESQRRGARGARPPETGSISSTSTPPKPITDQPTPS